MPPAGVADSAPSPTKAETLREREKSAGGHRNHLSLRHFQDPAAVSPQAAPTQSLVWADTQSPTRSPLREPDRLLSSPHPTMRDPVMTSDRRIRIRQFPSREQHFVYQERASLKPNCTETTRLCARPRVRDSRGPATACEKQSPAFPTPQKEP